MSTVYCLPAMSIIYCLLSIVYHLLSTDYWRPSIVYVLLSVSYYLQTIVYVLLSKNDCLPTPIVYQLLTNYCPQTGEFPVTYRNKIKNVLKSSNIYFRRISLYFGIFSQNVRFRPFWFYWNTIVYWNTCRKIRRTKTICFRFLL